MPSLNFKKEFVPGIRALLDTNFRKRTGIKPKSTTIRKKRKNPVKKGDRLFLYFGLKTKYCQKLGEIICVKAEDIRMVVVPSTDGYDLSIIIDGVEMSAAEINAFAKKDGFASVKDLIRWFKKAYGFPFEGQIIHMTNTYQRKYFCNKKVKDHGFALQLDATHKTILVTQESAGAAMNDRYVKELSGKFNYGVQVINPLFQ